MYEMRPAGNSRKGLIDLCRALVEKGRVHSVVEVGSFAGESAVILHDNLPEADIFCVDPWKAGYDESDAASAHDMAEVEAAFDRRTEGCERVLKCKGTSHDFEETYGTLPVDVAYLDGCHTYEAVLADIDFWLPRCKLAICGHDYTPNWPGVVKAVDETFGKPDHVFEDNSWVKWLT